MTLSELARLANVSVSVASKAFSGRGDVSETMRDHVFEIAKQYGCFHQFYNVPYDRRVVALIIPEAISKYYIKFVEEIKARLEAKGCTMLLSISNFDEDMEHELIRYYSEHGKVDALIVVNGKCEFPKADDIVFVKISGESVTADIVVCSDKRSGIDECLSALKNLGHKKIASIGEPLTALKEKALTERMEALGFEVRPEYTVCSPYRFEDAGKDGIKKLMALSEPPTAVICSYGYITAGAISELERQGKSIPEDISVVSFDPFPMMWNERYEVACVGYDIDKICDIAVEKLCKRFDAKKKPPREVFVMAEKFHMGNTILKI